MDKSIQASCIIRTRHFFGTIFIGHLAELQGTETKFISFKVFDHNWTHSDTRYGIHQLWSLIKRVTYLKIGIALLKDELNWRKKIELEEISWSHLIERWTYLVIII